MRRQALRAQSAEAHILYECMGRFDAFWLLSLKLFSPCSLPLCNDARQLHTHVIVPDKKNPPLKTCDVSTDHALNCSRLHFVCAVVSHPRAIKPYTPGWRASWLGWLAGGWRVGRGEGCVCRMVVASWYAVARVYYRRGPALDGPGSDKTRFRL